MGVYRYRGSGIMGSRSLMKGPLSEVVAWKIVLMECF